MGNRRNNYYDATIRRMVTESLQRKEEDFCRLHQKDPDDVLVHYLQEHTRILGHTPHEKEILGWTLILARFGSWQAAICKAGLSPPNTPNKISLFRCYIQEEALQKELYAQKKARKKEAARIREQEREKKKRMHQNDQPDPPEIINETCP